MSFPKHIQDPSLKHGKHRRKVKVYGIFRAFESGALLGYVENSFSMGWSTTNVLGVSLDGCKYFLKSIKKDKIDGKIFISRLTRENSRIKVDIESREKTIRDGSIKKYELRNFPFTVS